MQQPILRGHRRIPSGLSPAAFLILTGLTCTAIVFTATNRISSIDLYLKPLAVTSTPPPPPPVAEALAEPLTPTRLAVHPVSPRRMVEDEYYIGAIHVGGKALRARNRCAMIDAITDETEKLRCEVFFSRLNASHEAYFRTHCLEGLAAHCTDNAARSARYAFAYNVLVATASFLLALGALMYFAVAKGSLRRHQYQMMGAVAGFLANSALLVDLWVARMLHSLSLINIKAEAVRALSLWAKLSFVARRNSARFIVISTCAALGAIGFILIAVYRSTIRHRYGSLMTMTTGSDELAAEEERCLRPSFTVDP